MIRRTPLDFVGTSEPGLQALRSCGSRPNRDALVHTLERLQHFETGVTSPLTFGPNQRVGSYWGGHLSARSKRPGFVVVSDWITPKI